MVYMYKEIAETCCLGVYGLIRPEIDYWKTTCEKKTILLFYPCAQSLGGEATRSVLPVLVHSASVVFRPYDC